MNGFLHDTCFAECIGENAQFAMVIPTQKLCPSKIHTRKDTKIFGKLALHSKTWCRRKKLKVCSYCLQFPSSLKKYSPMTIAAFQESILVKPSPCNLNSEGFGNTPCQSE